MTEPPAPRPGDAHAVSAGRPAIVPLCVAVLAALSAGFGGLLIELVAVRRIGLILGNTASASAWVAAVFFAGLGAGGLWVASARADALRARGPGGAARVYGIVAVLLVAGDLLLRVLPPLGWGPGAILVVLHPGLAAFAMGVAFPLLFAVRVSAGWLIGANLLGSVAACAVGGVWLLPVAGFTVSGLCAAVAYGGAALCCAGLRSTVRTPAASQATAETGAFGVSAERSVYWIAGASGFATLAFEVLLLRRLPFFVEGFQPTLSGVLATCLLGLSVGAAFGPLVLRPLVARVGAATVAAWAAGIGGLLTCVGLTELAGRATVPMWVGSDLEFHGRIWLAALVAGAPACLALGAVGPLCVDALAGGGDLSIAGTGRRARVAGRVFFAQGLGALAGALAAGHLVPWLAPRAYFVVLPLVIAVGAVALVLLGRSGSAGAGRVPTRSLCGIAGLALLLGAVGLAGPGAPWDPTPPVRGSRYDHPRKFDYVDHRIDSGVTASVVYDRASHSMTLYTNEFRAAYTGPDTAYMKVLGHLPFLLREGLRDVAVIALGTGTTAAAVTQWPDPRRIDVVEISPAVLDLVDYFANDGPVWTGERAPFLRDPRTVVNVTDGRRWLAQRAAASLDLVTMEPLLPYAPGTAALYSREFYELARSRMRERGLFLQWVPTHSMPTEFFETLLATFGDVFPATSVWLVDQSTLLVGSATEHLDELELAGQRLTAAPLLAARTLHEAGLARPVDLGVALLGRLDLGALRDAERLTDDRPFLEHIGYWDRDTRLGFYGNNLRALLACVDRGAARADLAPLREHRLRGLALRSDARIGVIGPDAATTELTRARVLAPYSTLLHREETLAWRAHYERRVLLSDGGVDAAGVARGHVRRDPGSAILLAAAGLGQGADAEAAMQAACAVDPILFLEVDRLPRFLASHVPASLPPSPLADLANLPDDPEEIVTRASEPGPLGAALRAAFAVRVARAAVAVAESRPLGAALATLAPTFDPASLEMFAASVARSGRGDVALCREVRAVWRRDLLMPRSLVDVATSPDPAARAELGRSLRGHRGARALRALADLMEDAELSVRVSAAAVIAADSFLRDRIRFDPEWPESRRRAAAAAVRAWHDRGS